MASSLYNVAISDAWEYWCYYRRVLRNKNTGAIIDLDSGKFSPSTVGLLRIGEKVSELNDDEEIVEYSVLALQPDITRINIWDIPSSAKLMLYLSVVILNDGNFQFPVTVKPWANSSGTAWTSDTLITYNDIVEHYIPFDLTSETYVAATYEKSVNVEADTYNAYVIDLEETFYKFLQSQTIGFMITATGGYADVYGPTYSSSTVRPQFTIEQTISNRFHGPHITLDTEIAGLSKVKGVCRDRSGTIITGKQCRIVACNKDHYKILGTGLSVSANGTFLIDADCKVGELVAVSFYDSDDTLTGSELMTTVSYNTV